MDYGRNLRGVILKILNAVFSLAVLGVMTLNASSVMKHKVKSGETLYSVAHKYNSSIKEICKLNGLKRNAKIRSGKLLKVPGKTVASTGSSQTAKHKIQRGETLYSVARKYNTTLSKLKSLNGFSSNVHLKKGKFIKVPKRTSIAKNDKKLKIVLPKSANKKLEIVRLYMKKKKEEKSLAFKKSAKKRRTVTMDDIFFKSAQPYNMTFKRAGLSPVATASRPNYNNTFASSIIDIAKMKLGRKYVWGAVGRKGTFDCSGFTSYVYKKKGIHIPRTSFNQSKYGKFIPKANLKKGDLIFFDTSRKKKGYVNHVGIYMGNGKFIHASSAKKKVVITKLSNFYAQRYRGARRPL